MLVDSFAGLQADIAVQMATAIDAIQQYALKREEESTLTSGTRDLISDPESFTLNFSLNKIPTKKDYRFNQVVLAHSLVPDIETRSVCLIVRDPKETALASIKAAGISVDKVITVKSLKKKYTSHEARRELANRFDLFFCEDSIFELMGKLLGKYFFETKKSKIPFPLKSITSAVYEKSLRTSRFRVRGGAVVGIKIGNRSMSTEQLVENGIAAIEYMAKEYCVEKKTFNNVFNIMISATNIIGLPIWSVPTLVVEEAAAEVAVSVASTPKAVNPVKAVKPAQDIAEVPVKNLKSAQKQRVAAVKAELSTPVQKKARK